MKLAIAISKGRIAPLFDTSRRLLILELGEDRPVWSEDLELLEDGEFSRVAVMTRLNVHTLICGAISRELAASLEGRGVRVVAFISGDIDRVVQAFLADTLHSDVFCMPGCGCRRRRRHSGPSGREP